MPEAPHAIPIDFAPEVTTRGLTALLRQAFFAPLEQIGFLRVTGDDRVRWLNGMVTNSIQALAPSEGCYNFFLNAQGRIQGDATAFVREGEVWLETQRDRIPALVELLDRFIIMDDVELSPMEGFAGLLVAGAEAERLLAGLGFAIPAELHLAETVWNGFTVQVVHAYSPAVPSFELWAAAADQQALTEALIEALRAAGMGEGDAGTLEELRLLEGRPLYGVDIRDKELPQETAQTRALHFAKGCYLGQEIVERIRSRGAVHRSFTGFLLDGALPAGGTAIFLADAPEKPVGEITSAGAVALAEGSIQLGLGYIRREALEAAKVRGVALRYEGGAASLMTLPFKSVLPFLSIDVPLPS